MPMPLDFDGRPFVFGSNGGFGGTFVPQDLPLDLGPFLSFDLPGPPVAPELPDVSELSTSAQSPFGGSVWSLFAPADPPPPAEPDFFLGEWVTSLFGGQPAEAPADFGIFDLLFG